MRTRTDEHLALMTVHHIVSDGWSMGVLIRELGLLYPIMTRTARAQLPPLTAQYSDFAEWQRACLSGGALEVHLQYWRRQLSGVTPLDLQTDRPRPRDLTFGGATVTLILSEELSTSLRAISARQGATLFMTLLAALQGVLSHYTGQDDIVIGSPIAARGRPEFEDLIGFFINMIVLRGDLSGSPGFLELLGRVRQTTLDAYEHDVPLEQLVQYLQPDRDLSRQPLFQVSFSFENVPQERLSLGGLSVEPVGFESGTTRFELELHAHDNTEQLFFALLYNSDLFDETTIRRLLNHFQNLLREAMARPSRPVAHLAL
ncbi:MAG: condensation domain-containing protein, partial [Blastocatellia bacterium]